jgi:hypothetical protein
MKNSYLIPEQDKKYKKSLVVVLDVDETLIYAEPELLEINDSKDSKYAYKVHIRPYFAYLIESLKKINCEIIIWSAGTYDYINDILDKTQINRKLIDHIICRDDRWFTTKKRYKDLSQLNRDLSRTIMIENDCRSIIINIFNSVIVPSYIGEKRSKHQHHTEIIENDTTLLFVVDMIFQIYLKYELYKNVQVVIPLIKGIELHNHKKHKIFYYMLDHTKYMLYNNINNHKIDNIMKNEHRIEYIDICRKLNHEDNKE